MADIKTPMRAIRQQCAECMGGHTHEIKDCVDQGCPLWPYRLAAKPKPGSVEAKAVKVWEKRV